MFYNKGRVRFLAFDGKVELGFLPMRRGGRIQAVVPEAESNLDKDVLGGEKISYTGKADMSSNIIDTGLEIPTLIHKTAREALNLEIFDAEIRPYLEDIFIN